MKAKNLIFFQFSRKFYKNISFIFFHRQNPPLFVNKALTIRREREKL